MDNSIIKFNQVLFGTTLIIVGFISNRHIKHLYIAKTGDRVIIELHQFFSMWNKTKVIDVADIQGQFLIRYPRIGQWGGKPIVESIKYTKQENMFFKRGRGSLYY